MRRLSSPLLVLLTAAAALGLSACGAAAAQSSSAVLSAIYTSAANTVQAQVSAATPTAGFAPTSTSLPTSMPLSTLSPSATATTNSSVYSYAMGCEDAAYEGDVTIDDGTEFAPGESFSKIWSMKNTGSCSWSKNFYVTFVDGSEMGCSDTEIGTAVDPGELASVGVELTAPEDEGTYLGYWQLADSSGNAFGERVYVEIVVSDSAATSTPTSTPSPPATSTGVVNTSTPTIAPETATPTLEETPSSPTATGDSSGVDENGATPTPTTDLEPTSSSPTASIGSSTPTDTPTRGTPTPTVVTETQSSLARTMAVGPRRTSTSRET